MTYEQQRAKERELAAMRKRRIQRRNNCIAWLILICGVLVIFALGTLFGYHLTSHTPAGQADITASTQIAAKVHADDTTAKVIGLTSTTETPKGVPGLSLDYDLQKALYDSCRKYDVPFALALAVAEKESGFDPDAKSSTNDYGLMQINAVNFEWLNEKGIDPLTYDGNIEAGVLMLSKALDRYGEIELALMAYNCGDTGAKRLWDAGTYSTEYSGSVMERYQKWVRVLEDK